MSRCRRASAFRVLLAVLLSLVWMGTDRGVPAGSSSRAAAAPARMSAPPANGTIITGLDSLALVARVAREQGFTAQRDRMEGGAVEPARKGELLGASWSLAPAPNLERWGSKFKLRAGDCLIGGLQIGVFADPEAARQSFLDQIRHTSTGPNRSLRSALADEAVGWWDPSRQGFGRILLRRGNVVASVALVPGGVCKILVPAETAWQLAQRLDAALTSGSDGVRRGAKPVVPSILAVEMPKAPAPRRTPHARVHMIMPAPTPSEKAAVSEVVHDVPFHPPLAAGDWAPPESELRWELVHITADGIVCSQLLQVVPAPLPPAR